RRVLASYTTERPLLDRCAIHRTLRLAGAHDGAGRGRGVVARVGAARRPCLVEAEAGEPDRAQRLVVTRADQRHAGRSRRAAAAAVAVIARRIVVRAVTGLAEARAFVELATVVQAVEGVDAVAEGRGGVGGAGAVARREDGVIGRHRAAVARAT